MVAAVILPKDRPLKRPLLLAALAALAALAVLLAIPGVSGALLMATLGFAFPLLAAGALCLYLAAALAGSALGLRGPRWLAVAGAAAAVLILALAPGLASRWQAGGVAGSLRAADVTKPPLAQPRSIELREPFSSLVPAAAFETLPCGQECRALLLSGAVDWVRLVRTAAQADFMSTSLFRAASGAACPAPETGQGPGARCALFAPDDGRPAEMVVDAVFLDRPALAAFQPSVPLAPDIRFGRRLTARAGSAALYERTEVSIDTVTIPFVIWPASMGTSSGGYEIWRRRDTLAPVALADMFSALGYSQAMELAKSLPPGSAEMREPPTADLVNRAVSALDLPPSTPLNRTHLEFIARWINHARWQKPLPPEAIGLVRRILLDPRVVNYGQLDQLLARPEVAPGVLSDLLDVVETRKLTDRLDAPRQALSAMRAMAPGELEPQRARIQRLAAGRGATADAMKEIEQRLR